jgi:hypothetical protein
MQLEWERLWGNPNAKVTLAGPVGTFEGFRQQEFSIGGQAEYSNPFAASMQDKGLMAGAIASTVSNATGGLVDLPIVTLRNKEQTRHHWTNSQRPSIPVNLTLVRFSLKAPSVSQVSAQILSCLYPKGGGGLLNPPGGYDAKSGGGTWTVQIGTYFRAPLLLLINGQASFSPTSVQDGSPLYANLSLTFEPYMIIDEGEFKGYFLK